MKRGRSQWLRLLLVSAVLVMAAKILWQSASSLQQYGITATAASAVASSSAAASSNIGGGISGSISGGGSSSGSSSSSSGRSSIASAAPDSSSVASLVQAFLAAPLPPRNLNLSEQAPLFFFHQRKTAGSSLRATIVQAAKDANLSYFVPCHDGVPCDLYHIGTNFSAIYAGHFYWGEQRELSRRSSFDPAAGTWHNPRHNASCLTMFRDPVSRLESCYYFRFVQERAIRDGHFSCLSNLKAREMRSMFADGRTLYGRGCLNEPFRILSGLTDELDLTALSNSSTAEGSLLNAALALTLKHLSGCVPLVLEDPRSLQLAQHWFPQLAPAFVELKKRNKGLARRCPMTERAQAVLQELAAGEQIVYDAARRRVEVMLAARQREPCLPARGAGFCL
ncbi:hypothetical protein ABPG75_001127 [Micractinium tetrahymenae]